MIKEKYSIKPRTLMRELGKLCNRRTSIPAFARRSGQILNKLAYIDEFPKEDEEECINLEELVEFVENFQELKKFYTNDSLVHKGNAYERLERCFSVKGRGRLL